MKKIYIFIIIIALIAGGIGIYLYNKNKTSSNNSSQKLPPYNTTKVSTNNETSNTNMQENTSAQNSSSTASENQFQENTSTTENTQNPAPTIETELASFTTKIYTKDSDRQTNISITCSNLNETTIENGQTFSFCDTVGKASSSKGYKKADVFVDGKKIEALGRSEIAK